MFKEFLMKQMLKRQLKGMPQAEQDRIIKAVSSNPELFQKIAKETQEKVKGGMSQMHATMAATQKYKEELQKVLGQ